MVIVKIPDLVLVHMTAQDMESVANAWHITEITMRACPDVSFPRRLKPPMTEA